MSVEEQTREQFIVFVEGIWDRASSMKCRRMVRESDSDHQGAVRTRMGTKRFVFRRAEKYQLFQETKIIKKNIHNQLQNKVQLFSNWHQFISKAV
jgi:glutamine synthetase adenylyltransferase